MLKVLEMREAASSEREELTAAAAASMQALEDRVQCLQVCVRACAQARVRATCLQAAAVLLVVY